ncbi:MAG: glycosyl hydrolase [Eubacterium sp.]|nr:glycosyl hydrolase [Eubacterium sp.]
MHMRIYTSTADKQWFEHNAEEGRVNTTLDLDGTEHQEWDGFGGCFNELSQMALLSLGEEERNVVYDMLFSKEADGLRFDFCRIPIGASDYAESWYSLNESEGDYEMKNFSIERDRKYLIPYIKEALKRNPHMKFFASPWSPPTWMKYPKANNYGTLVWTEENLKAYAMYFVKFIEAYEKEGIAISQLHLQNEPVSSQKFPSCIWTGEQFAEFIVKYLGPLFEEKKIETKIWLGTLNCPETDERAPYTRFNNYANLVLHDEEAYKYIEGVSYQWAGKYAVQITHECFPEKKLIQSENECGDGKNTWEYAKYVYELFRHYIHNEVNAYVYWNMALPPKGKSTWGWEQNSMITIDGKAEYNYEYYVMKHFARFIRPKARRLGLKGHFSGTSVAFKNPDGSKILVVQNPFSTEKTFVFNGQSITLTPDSINTVIF